MSKVANSVTEVASEKRVTIRAVAALPAAADANRRLEDADAESDTFASMSSPRNTWDVTPTCLRVPAFNGINTSSLALPMTPSRVM
jgi:hypothetical protein